MEREKALRADSTREAVEYLMAAITFFLLHHPKKTIVILILLFGSAGFFLHDYITTEKARILEASPIGASVLDLSLIPAAYAAGEPIKIDGKVYGYRDDSVDVWKLEGENMILVHDKDDGVIFKIEVAALSHARMRSLKKQK